MQSQEEFLLSELAEVYKTDKREELHGYTKVYEEYFAPLRNKPITFLEIGFFNGASARMWDEYFSEAKLHFIDNVPDSFKEENIEGLSSRCAFHIVDQGDPQELQEFIEKSEKEFDVIIDDGGHKPFQQITSFEMLFPHLKSGGVYVIEDLHAAYWMHYGGLGTRRKPKLGSNTVIQFLHGLINDLNYVGAYRGYANFDNCPKKVLDKLSYYQEHIKEIHFYSCICFIVKR